MTLFVMYVCMYVCMCWFMCDVISVWCVGLVQYVCLCQWFTSSVIYLCNYVWCVRSFARYVFMYVRCWFVICV